MALLTTPPILPKALLPVALLALVLACCKSMSPQLEDEVLKSTAYNVASCETLQAPASVVGLDGTDLQVVSWNIYKGALPGWREDLDNMQQGLSVLLLQEAPFTAELTDPLPADWSWQFAPGYKQAQLQTGVMSIAAAPALQQCTAKHKEPWLRTPKALLVTTYALQHSSKTLMVGNLHALNFMLGTGAYRRQIKAMAALLAEHDGPIIVGGDFNDWRQKRTDVIAELFGRLGLQRVEFTSPDRLQVLGRSVDHIYYKGLELVSDQVTKLSSSDHNPIRAHFRLPAADGLSY